MSRNCFLYCTFLTILHSYVRLSLKITIFHVFLVCAVSCYKIYPQILLCYVYFNIKKCTKIVISLNLILKIKKIIYNMYIYLPRQLLLTIEISCFYCNYRISVIYTYICYFPIFCWILDNFNWQTPCTYVIPFRPIILIQFIRTTIR